MIKPKDLRIGNLFRDKLTGKILTVSDLTLTKVGFSIHNDEILQSGWQQAEPIKLTPEILDKIEGCIFDGFYEIGRLAIDFNRDEHGNFKHSAFIKDSLIDNFNYLHELQNIYYYTHNKQELSININALKV